MEYVPPIGGDPDDPYIDANPAVGQEGSAVPAAIIEHPAREIVNFILLMGLVPDGGDLTQLGQAVLAAIAAQNLGSSAYRDVGTAAGNVPEVLVATGKLDPAVIPAFSDTILDQLALTNARLMLASSVASGALIAGYQWELASDEWGATSSDETYTAPTGGAPGYYSNGGGYTVDQIPTMTSANTPSGVASASNENGLWPAWKAFDKNPDLNTGWETQNGVTAARLEYEFDTPKRIGKVVITPMGAGSNAPRDFTIDLYNGASYQALATYAGITWSTGVAQTFIFDNPDTVTRYSINTTATGGSVVGIAEVNMMAINHAVNMTLVHPAAVPVASPPANLAGFFLWKDELGTCVLGTDIKAEFSRDAGATWTEGNLELLAAFDGSYSFLGARADVSGQPTGTDCFMRISTYNTKSQRVAAPALYVEN
ncbi:MAG: discoidin domain-containing protein [Rhodospirillales bacterium]|jgi:hypothetical protein|nr:discoidin domain-containing protein [Rhodospirillales bacterium]